MTENQVGDEIISAAMVVHSALGPGLSERSYEICLAHELTKRDLRLGKQIPIPIRYDDHLIEDAYPVDLLVTGLVVLEIKSIETVHRGQLLSYLRLGRFKLGYLLNFNVAHMRDGTMRLVNGLQ